MSQPLIYLPEHQKIAANKLLQLINDAVSPLIGLRAMNKETERELGIKIAESIREWFKQHPFYTRFNIDFSLELDEANGKIKIIPSYDMQRLMAGAVTEHAAQEGLLNLKGNK